MMDNLTNHVSFVPFEGIDQIYLKDSNHPEVNVRAKTDDWQDIDQSCLNLEWILINDDGIDSQIFDGITILGDSVDLPPKYLSFPAFNDKLEPLKYKITVEVKELNSLMTTSR